MKLQRGIVVRSVDPERKRITLFDEEIGLCDAYVSQAYRAPVQLCHGILVEYCIEQWRERLFITEYRFIARPAQEVCSDIYFLHQLLDVAYHGFPHHMPLPEIFVEYLCIYAPHYELFFAQPSFKVAFLCKVFALLGIYPEEYIYYNDEDVRCLILSPLDIMFDIINNTQHMQKAAKAWLMGCIAQHPRARSFYNAPMNE